MSFPIPPIKFVPGHPNNAYATRQGFTPEAVVLHIADGTLAGCDSWFANPAAGAGAHFCVGKSGEIHQYYRLDQAPHANGGIEAGYTAQLIDDNKKANPNFWTVSVEHEGKPGDIVSTAQFAASTQLTAWLFDSLLIPGGANGLAIDRKHIIRHGDISPSSRPNCPGWTEGYIARYIERVKALLTGTAPPPVDPKDATIVALTARVKALEDAMTVQARARRTDAAAATIQAGNLEALVKGGAS